MFSGIVISALHMRVLLLALYFIILLLEVNAVTKTWVGVPGAADQKWSTSSNWSPAGVPAANDDVEINQNQIASLGYDVVELPRTAVSCKSLNLSASSQMQINSTTLSVSEQMTLDGQVSCVACFIIEASRGSSCQPLPVACNECWNTECSEYAHSWHP